MADVHVVVLAAGKGTRMKSAVPKILHRAAGLPLIEHVLRAVDPLQPASRVMIIGHKTDDVTAALAARSDLQFAIQEPQLGTGHALLQAESLLNGKQGCVLLVSGDVPLV